MKCDLPEPKKPETQTPIFPATSGSFGWSTASQIRREELAEVLVEFPGDDELVQLLPDGGVVQLVGLHDAVDGPEDVPLEEVLDLHVGLDFTAPA